MGCVERVTVLYDGGCGLCRWSVGRLDTWDRRGRIRFVPIASEEAGTLLTEMEPDRRLASWHLVTRDRRVLSAGAAVPPLLRELPGGRPIARLAAAAPSVTDLLYRTVARRRAALGRLLRLDACDARLGGASAP